MKHRVADVPHLKNVLWRHQFDSSSEFVKVSICDVVEDFADEGAVREDKKVLQAILLHVLSDCQQQSAK